MPAPMISPVPPISYPHSPDRYAADIQRVNEALNHGIPLPINPNRIDQIRAHLRRERDHA